MALSNVETPGTLSNVNVMWCAFSGWNKKRRGFIKDLYNQAIGFCKGKHWGISMKEEIRRGSILRFLNEERGDILFNNPA